MSTMSTHMQEGDEVAELAILHDNAHGAGRLYANAQHRGDVGVRQVLFQKELRLGYGLRVGPHNLLRGANITSMKFVSQI